jgi:radical SAM protein with 4Fe4S-binding SPASM domain
MPNQSTRRRSKIVAILVRIREKVQERGLVRAVGRGVYHLGQAVVRGRNARHSWQLLTDQVPELQRVNVEVTTYCNLRCPGCQRTIIASGADWNNQYMPLEKFRLLVEQLPTVHEFSPTGIGEPTLHPDLPEMIRIAHASGKFNEITLTTHGMAHDVDYFCRLFADGLDKLYISVDTLDSRLIERLRAGTKLDVLKARLAELSQRFPEQVVAGVTLGRLNIGHLPDMLEQLNMLAGKLEIAIHPYDDLGDAENCLSLEERLAFVEQAAAWTGRYPHLTFNLQGFVPSAEVCPSPWRSPSVKVNGELTPCCRIMYHQQFSFGNVFEKSYDAVSNSPETQQWREEFEKSTPAICLDCPLYVPRFS